jgi:hypothetical protein
MCGSIDTIESTQLAIDSYNCIDKNSIKSVGFDKLTTYGLFQALYVQQDAVSNLCNSLDIDLLKITDIKTQHLELYEIRQLRNKGIGHPSREGKANNTHNILIDKDTIELFNHTETGEFSFAKYKMSDCIERQNQLLYEILQKVVGKMSSIEKGHKDKYKRNKLINCFPDNPQYCIGKIFEVINLIDVQDQEETLPQRIGRENGIGLALSHSGDLIKSIDKFEEEITERGLRGDNAIFIRIEIGHSKYPLEKLKDYFCSGSKSSLNSQDARAYADSAREHMLELIKHTKKLDELYENPA